MKRFIVILALFPLLPGLVFAQIELQNVAMVRLSKSQSISVKEFKDYVKWTGLSSVKADGLSNPEKEKLEEARKAVLDTLCNQLLVCQAAEQEKVVVTDRELNQQFNDQMKPLIDAFTRDRGRAPTDAELDTAFATMTGMTRAALKEQIRRSMIAEKYLQFKKQAILGQVKPPTDAEVQTLYNRDKAKSLFEGGFVRPDAVRIRMIWVPAVSASEKAAALNRATQLVQTIGGDPGKFDEVVNDAKPSLGYQAGDGPYIYKHDQFRVSMGVDFYDTVFRLKQGEVSKLLERPDGYYIVKVTETYRQKTLTLEDIYALGNPMKITVKQYIYAAESQRRENEARTKASEELVAELKKRGSVQIDNDIYKSIAW
ncbi:MAG: peptidylprolyl isomerase [Treponema sp.]|nr:peptidylprolyl isomerase [Treponema sp.]